MRIWTMEVTRMRMITRMMWRIMMMWAILSKRTWKWNSHSTSRSLIYLQTRMREMKRCKSRSQKRRRISTRCSTRQIRMMIITSPKRNLECLPQREPRIDQANPARSRPKPRRFIKSRRSRSADDLIISVKCSSQNSGPLKLNPASEIKLVLHYSHQYLHYNEGYSRQPQPNLPH